MSCSALLRSSRYPVSGGVVGAVVGDAVGDVDALVTGDAVGDGLPLMPALGVVVHAIVSEATIAAISGAIFFFTVESVLGLV
jgi:hypothetical protein